jgi:hypothetical protein
MKDLLSTLIDTLV